MKNLISFSMKALTAWIVMAAPSLAESLVIFSPDDTFLGVVGHNGELCSEHELDCIWNRYSRYGSEYSGTSIFNNYGQYGSEMGRHSVCNHQIAYEETPSLLSVDGNYVAFYDVIGPDSVTQVGQTLYLLACLR
jgi:hypothetical protein